MVELGLNATGINTKPQTTKKCKGKQIKIEIGCTYIPFHGWLFQMLKKIDCNFHICYHLSYFLLA